MEISKEILRRTTPYKGDIDYIVEDQSAKDIINAMIESHGLDERDYDNICSLFDAPTAEEIGYNIWIFLRKDVPYEVEGEELQTVRSPGALIATAGQWGADCKNYSLFSGGVIDALNRKGAGIPWVYRFASYKWYKQDPYHVFVVMYPGSKDEIWIDAVLPHYDYHKVPTHFKDKKIMGLARVSGVRYEQPNRYMVVNGQVFMGDPGDDSGDDSGDDYTYYEESDPIDGSSDPSDTSTGFDLSSGAGAAAASQSSPDLGSSDLVNPSAGATAATPEELDPELDMTGGNYYNPDLGDTDQQAANEAAASAAAPSLLSRLASALTGGGGGSSGGGASGGGASGSSSSQQKQPTQQQQGSGTNIYLPAQSTSSNTTLYIVLGAGALLAIILLMRKK